MSMYYNVSESKCPECGGEPTTDPERIQQLKALGYVHDDRTLKCHNGHEWTIGVPIGKKKNEDEWVCDSCGYGSYRPHFIYLRQEDCEAVAKVKCDNCCYVPDDPLELAQTSGPLGTEENYRIFVGHPDVTGSQTNVDPNV